MEKVCIGVVLGDRQFYAITCARVASLPSPSIPMVRAENVKSCLAEDQLGVRYSLPMCIECPQASFYLALLTISKLS
jgi:hypothetical protein